MMIWALGRRNKEVIWRPSEVIWKIGGNRNERATYDDDDDDDGNHDLDFGSLQQCCYMASITRHVAIDVKLSTKKVLSCEFSSKLQC